MVLDVQLLLCFNLFPVETLDDVDRVDDVLDALAFRFKMAAHLPAPAFEPPRLADGDPEIDRDDGQGHEAHPHIGREHQDQSQQGAREQRQQVDEEVLDRAGKAAHALVDPGLELAGGIFARIEKSHPEGHDLFDDALGQVPAHEDAHPFAEVILGESDQGREDFLGEEDNRDDSHDTGGPGPLEIGPDKRVDRIDGPVEDNGVDLGHERAHQGQDQGDGNQPFVRLDKRPEMAKELEKVHGGQR